MFKQNTATHLQSTTLWAAVVSMVLSLLLPLFLSVPAVQAGQLVNRSITLETSQVSATGVTYDISFDLAASQTLGGVVIDICSNSPLVDTACTAAAGFDWTTGGLGTVTGWTGATHDTAATADDANTLVLSDATPDVAVTGTITIQWTTATNPSGTPGAFYARIVTYDDGTKGDTYLSTNADNGGAHTDDGGVAMSTAAEIVVTARVQETLTFCVGTADPGAGCSGISGTSVDLGVLSNSLIDRASTESGLAYLQVTTNASSGVTVSYYADNLKVSGAACGITDVEGASVTSDKCINQDANPDAGSGAIVAGTEQWGMAVTSHPDDGTETTNAFTPAAAYDYDTADEFAFAPNAVTTLGSSSGVVDSEQFNMDIAATINLTTPSGLYQTTINYVATGVF